MPTMARKNAMLAAVLLSAILFVTTPVNAQGQAPASTALTNAQVQALIRFFCPNKAPTQRGCDSTLRSLR
jgi:hypothetical protein